MQLKNCSDCGILMLTPYTTCCESCSRAYLEHTRTVKAYLTIHPRANLVDVYQATGVPLKALKDIVRTI